MSIAENEELDDRGIKAWDDGDAEAFVNLFGDEFVLTDVGVPEPVTTKDGIRQYVSAWFTAFPDMSVKRINRVTSEDAVAGEVEFSGTNTGPMMMGGKEIPATGKSVRGRGMYLVKIKDGVPVEFHSYPDIAGMMMQLGFMPPM